MTVTTSWQGQVLVASLCGELNMKNHDTLSTELRELAQVEAKGLVLNFAEVVYIASVGIGMLLNLVKMGRERGMKVRLAGVRPAVRMVLEMVRADSTLPMDASVNEAVGQLAA